MRLQVLEQVSDVLTGWNLYEIMTNPRASHVARRLLSVAAGRDVSPPSGKKVRQLQAHRYRLAPCMAISKCLSKERALCEPRLIES